VLALPASGKSEVRRYLAHLTPDQCRNDFHMAHGPARRLPYVHMMRRVSQESTKLGQGGAFFDADELPMKEPLDWGMLIELLNEDYDDLVKKNRPRPSRPRSGSSTASTPRAPRSAPSPRWATCPPTSAASSSTSSRRSARASCARRTPASPTRSPEDRGHGVRRGGADGSKMPLPSPYGYQYSLSVLSDAILPKPRCCTSGSRRGVAPEEPRARRSQQPGSILNHGVPLPVMMGDYGCDDMEYLLQQSDKPDT